MAEFTEEGLEFNFEELQAAINESAEQHRDEDEEAIRRNQGCPTYGEACAMQIYDARPGETYVFQGPSPVTLGGETGRPMELEVVGEMDVQDALRIANRDSRSGTVMRRKQMTHRGWT